MSILKSRFRSFFVRALQTIFLSGVLTSCLYEMPSDDYVSVIPVTNNPDVTRDTSTMIMPGADF